MCIITGSNSGIGKAAAKELARAGLHVVLACRNPERGAAAQREIQEQVPEGSVELRMLDVSEQASIRRFSEDFRATFDQLDVLIHNAAIFDITQKRAHYTGDGIETLWATNHLGPVYLTEHLIGPLRKSEQGRVITVASKGLRAKPFLKVDLQDPELKSGKFRVTQAYYQAKRAQVMYTSWLARRLQDTKVTANCIEVPAVRVDVSRYPELSGPLRFLYSFKSRFAKTPEELARVYAHLATSEKMEALSGQYLDEKLRVIVPSSYMASPENIEAVMRVTMAYLEGSPDPIDEKGS